LIAQKNWSTQKYQLLNASPAVDKKVKTGQKSKIICRTCILSSFTFRQKKYLLLELQLVDKGFVKCQLLDTNYSKEYGVHVRQLG
jgi:hypothetical protein